MCSDQKKKQDKVCTSLPKQKKSYQQAHISEIEHGINNFTLILPLIPNSKNQAFFENLRIFKNLNRQGQILKICDNIDHMNQ